MQNEPNLKIDPMAVTKVLTTVYNKRTLGIRGKNEPKTNPMVCLPERVIQSKKSKICETKPIQSQFYATCPALTGLVLWKRTYPHFGKFCEPSAQPDVPYYENNKTYSPPKDKTNFARIRAPKSSAFLLGTVFFICAAQEAVTAWILGYLQPAITR